MPSAHHVSTLALPGAAAASVVWRWQGALHVTAVVKATFGFPEGGPMKHLKPLAIRERDEDDGSHVDASELAPLLGAVDIILKGHAYAPQGAAVSRLDVALEIWRGRDRLLYKSVEHVATSGAGGTLGAITRAPLGRIGMGAIPRSAPARAGRLGALSPEALAREPLELPDDIDWSFFHAAPVDLRLGDIEGGERIVLRNMHATAPEEAIVPHARAAARLASSSGAETAFDMRADMLVIDTDRRLCSVVWRGHLPIGRETDLSIVAGVHVGKAAAARQIAEATVLQGDDSSHDAVTVDDQQTTIEVRAKPGTTLPFKDGPRSPLPREVFGPRFSGTASMSEKDAAQLRALVASPFPPTAVAPPADARRVTHVASPTEIDAARSREPTPFRPGRPNIPPPSNAVRQASGTLSASGIDVDALRAAALAIPPVQPPPAVAHPPRPPERYAPPAPIPHRQGAEEPSGQDRVRAFGSGSIPERPPRSGPAGAFLAASPVSLEDASDDMPAP